MEHDGKEASIQGGVQEAGGSYGLNAGESDPPLGFSSNGMRRLRQPGNDLRQPLRQIKGQG